MPMRNPVVRRGRLGASTPKDKGQIEFGAEKRELSPEGLMQGEEDQLQAERAERKASGLSQLKGAQGHDN
ncbi:hypothetical protein N7540_000363 [Penicillium herquei]|nr:hypothetical protein N7540_000363 [Penicillium herquei]